MVSRVLLGFPKLVKVVPLNMPRWAAVPGYGAVSESAVGVKPPCPQGAVGLYSHGFSADPESAVFINGQGATTVC